MKYFIALMLVVMVGCSSEAEAPAETVPADTTVVVSADTTTVVVPN